LVISIPKKVSMNGADPPLGEMAGGFRYGRERTGGWRDDILDRSFNPSLKGEILLLKMELEEEFPSGSIGLFLHSQTSKTRRPNLMSSARNQTF
jgi:hypothetical protein